MKATLEPLIKKFMPFAQKKMGFNKPAKILFRDDADNAKNPLGKTAYYDPDKMAITLYVTDRHPKDVMRSLSHELIHHTQNCNGQFENTAEMGEGYAQKDEHLREMEREAYEQGNLIFRDWEDGIKNTIYYESLQGVRNKMSTKEWKSDELKVLLTEKWGFKMDLTKLNENNDKVFAPNHYCAHHVRENSSGQEGTCVDHNWNEKLQEVTAYDVDFGGGDIRTLSVSDLTILEASLPEGHDGHPAKRDDEEEIDEVAGVSPRDQGRRKPHKRKPVPEKEEDLEEGGAMGHYSGGGTGDALSTEDLFKLMDAGYGPDDLRGLNYSNLTPEMASILGGAGEPGPGMPMEEGGAAARTGNEDKDVGRGRMHTDRVHEGEEADEDVEELEETGLADRPENAPQAKAGRGGKDRYKRISEEQIKEILRKAIELASSNKGD